MITTAAIAAASSNESKQTISEDDKTQPVDNVMSHDVDSIDSCESLMIFCYGLAS